MAKTKEKKVNVSGKRKHSLDANHTDGKSGSRSASTVMEANAMQQGHEGDDEEFVLLDLAVLSGNFQIPPNAPYVLSGLDTLNPELIIDDKIKLIGEYEETVGTCFAFSEDEAAPVGHEETGSSELNLFSGKCIVDSNQAPRKQVKPVARLHKILKFRILHDDKAQDTTTGASV